MRRGYVSKMKMNEEEIFVEILRNQMKLEVELEEVKEEMIMYCHDFNSVQAFKIFVPNLEKAHKNISIFNMRDAFAKFGVKLN
jgi:hypothetical protein